MNKIFSKDKNRVMLIGYIAFIYGTLQFMPTINSFFSSLLGRYFGSASNAMLLIVILIIFVLIFKRKPMIKRPLLFYAATALIFTSYLAILIFVTPIVAEKLHLLEYGFLSYLALRTVTDARPLWKQNVFIILIVVLVGYCDELIQGFTPGRYYETRDVILNIISGILGLSVLRLYTGKKG